MLIKYGVLFPFFTIPISSEEYHFIYYDKKYLKSVRDTASGWRVKPRYGVRTWQRLYLQCTHTHKMILLIPNLYMAINSHIKILEKKYLKKCRGQYTSHDFVLMRHCMYERIKVYLCNIISLNFNSLIHHKFSFNSA